MRSSSDRDISLRNSPVTITTSLRETAGGEKLARSFAYIFVSRIRVSRSIRDNGFLQLLLIDRSRERRK